MKKSILFVAAICALALSSCGSVSNHYSATKIPVGNTVSTNTVADLQVGAQRVSFTFNPTSQDRVSGRDNCINAAVQAFLKANGNADVIVAPEYKCKADNSEITVSGYPAFYRNFRSAN